MKEKNDFLADFFLKKRKTLLRGTFWFVLTAVVVLIISIIPERKHDFIAKVYINDIILNNEDLFKKLDDLKDKNNLKGILVNINSPGGTVVGSQQIYEKLKKLGKKIPIAISMQEVAASGGYMISLAGDKIFCHRGTITGSIGVILQSVSINNLLEKLGVDPLLIKSGKMKASPNPLEKVDEETKSKILPLVNDMYQDFLSLVIQSRTLSEKSIEVISDGSVFTGNQAVKLNLVDSIGDENDALEWLKQKANLKSDIKVIDIEETKDIFNFFDFSNKKLKNFNGFFALWAPYYE